jgi:hypothetical protein
MGIRPWRQKLGIAWLRNSVPLVGQDVGPPALQDAAYDGNLTKLLRLVASGGCDVNVVHPVRPRRPGWQATRLLAGGLTFGLGTPQVYETPLFVAAERGHIIIVCSLLAAGADPELACMVGAPSRSAKPEPALVLPTHDV